MAFYALHPSFSTSFPTPLLRNWYISTRRHPVTLVFPLCKSKLPQFSLMNPIIHTYYAQTFCKLLCVWVFQSRSTHPPEWSEHHLFRSLQPLHIFHLHDPSLTAIHHNTMDVRAIQFSFHPHRSSLAVIICLRDSSLKLWPSHASHYLLMSPQYLLNILSWLSDNKTCPHSIFPSLSISISFLTSAFPCLPPSTDLLHSIPTTCKLVPANPLCIHYMIDDSSWESEVNSEHKQDNFKT